MCTCHVSLLLNSQSSLRRAVRAVGEAVHLVAQLGRREVERNRPAARRGVEPERATRHAHVAHFAPVLAPGVPHDPVQPAISVCAPPHDGNRVVSRVAFVGDDAARVVQYWIRINVARDGPAAEELLLHGRGANDVAELCTRNATKWKPTEQFGLTTRLEKI